MPRGVLAVLLFRSADLRSPHSLSIVMVPAFAGRVASVATSAVTATMGREHSPKGFLE